MTGLAAALAELMDRIRREAEAADVQELTVVAGAEETFNQVSAPPRLVIEPVSESIGGPQGQRLETGGARLLAMRAVTVRLHLYAVDIEQAEALLGAVVNATKGMANGASSFGEAAWEMGEIADHGVAYTVPLTLQVPLYRRERRTTVTGVGPVTAELDTSTT